MSMEKNIKIHNKLIDVAESNHPELAWLIKVNGVVKLTKNKEKDLFKFLARTVTGQQLSKAAAQTIWSRVENFAAERDEPIIELCIKRNEERLHDCGLSKNKVKTLIELHKRFSDGVISYEHIAKEGYDGLSAKIKSLWGFGQWSADMVAIFFLSHPDIWPEDDAALVRGMGIFIGARKNPAKAAVLYSPYRTYLAKHIWMGLDSGIIFDL